MLLLAIWIAVGLGVALWSLLGWGLYALLTADPARWLGDLQSLIDDLPFGDVLDAWVPGWQALVSTTIEAVQWALGWAGTSAPVVVWAVWGLGTLVMAGAGGLASLAVVLLREPPPKAPGAA